ncbi:MAG: exodeoxyribonuclease VII small subunit [Desulfobacterales bacterium]
MAKQNFENAMQKLEEITKELEAGDLPLEKALQRFEEGVKLSKFCSDKLEETEKRVTILLKDVEGNLLEKPFLTENNT